MRADRLLSILLLLQAHGRLPARRLAERLDAQLANAHDSADFEFGEDL
jgi:predicted DNA-binding transcriptional regulator YafY